jgi:amidase
VDGLGFKEVGELSALLRAGQISPAELVEDALRRIEAAGPRLNAFVDVGADAALEAARAIKPDDRRALAGIPVAVKAGTGAAGLISDHGSAMFAGHRYERDAFLVRRLREAGLIVVGTTRMPELGILPTTEPRHGGAVRNPWNTDHTPGGSSGGAAAAVAAGLVPIAHGSDGGGSIRIPAACCGLLGLKPSRGRISRGPALGDDYLVVDGVLTRTVTDTALALDVLAGYEVGDATWSPRPQEPFHVAIRRDPGRLRIALAIGNVLDAPVDPQAERAAREAAAMLEQLGHEVEEVAGMTIGPEALGLFTAVFAADKARAVEEAQTRLGRPLEQDEIEPLTRAFVDQANAMTAGQYLAAYRRLQLLARDVVAFFADYDCLLTPALAQRPPRIGELHGCGDDPLVDFARSGQFTPYTALFNVSGQPAISIPWGIGEDGLPLAVHVAAHPLAEDTLLQIARQVEVARPWADATPPGLRPGP